MSIVAFRRYRFPIWFTLLITLLVQPVVAGTTAFHSAAAIGHAQARPASIQATGPAVDVIGSIGGIGALAVQQGDIGYFGEAAAITVLNLQDPAHPIRLGRVLLPETVSGLDLAGDLLYAVATNGLHILDVSDPSHPTHLGEFALAEVKRIQTVGTRVYLSTRSSANDGLYIIDASDAAHPQLAGHYQLNTEIKDWHVVGTVAYLVTGGLLIVDLSNPANPTLLGSYVEGIRSVFAVGTVAYIVASTSVKALDVSVPASPHVIGSILVSGDIIRVFGNRIYISDYNDTAGSLTIVNSSDPTRMSRCGSYTIVATTIRSWRATFRLLVHARMR